MPKTCEVNLGYVGINKTSSPDKGDLQKRHTNKHHTGERQDAFPLRPGTRQELHSWPFLFSILLEALTKVIRQENQMRFIQMKRSKTISISR